MLSHSGPIQAGAEKLGICGSVRGRLGTLGRGTLARLLVNDLSPLRSVDSREGNSLKERETKRSQEETLTATVTDSAANTQ